jgi:DNA modification methylase
MRVEHGDCLDVMRRLIADGVQVDSVVTDPPYHLTSIVKRFGKPGSAECKVGATGAYARSSKGFMGKEWDGGDIAFRAETWELALQLLKPGGHLVAFSGTRTYHRMACAIEDAGFEIRDQLAWCYGSGFPKSHDISKAIEATLAHGGSSTIQMRKAAMGGDYKPYDGAGEFRTGKTRAKNSPNPKGAEFAPATEAAREWQGWGSALKPAWEPIALARKPLIGTVAANVLAHGTGALNVDGCRVEAEPWTHPGSNAVGGVYGDFANDAPRQNDKGRWPANLLHDGSPEVLAGFPETGGKLGGGYERAPSESIGTFKTNARTTFDISDAGGSAARFFYSAKADASDRLGSKHPTVKPTDLMAWLCRLITPPGGTVLDPFAGSGSTGMACLREGFDAILIEREAEYIADIKRRLAHVKGEDSPLFMGVAQ